jgi:Ca2+-binding EF-hand superfamily protein
LKDEYGKAMPGANIEECAMKFLALTALAVAGLAAPLAAQPPEGRGGRTLPATRVEVEPLSRLRFASRDVNQDGFLTADELGPRAPMMLERLDANHDGKISTEENSNGMLALFDRVDANHDGTISDAERSGAMAMMGGQRQPRSGGLAMLPSTRAEMQQMTQQLFARQDANHDGFLAPDELGERAPAALARLDADHDGKISAAENGAGLLTLFDRVDADHDGTISDAERAAATAAMNAGAPPSGPGTAPAPRGN